jgi:hypothetical protein
LIARAAIAFALVLADPAAGIAQEGTRELARIVATSQVEGALGLPVCTGDRAAEPTEFGHQTANLIRYSGDRAFIIDTGGLMNPGGFARFASSRAPEQLAALVADLGYRALSFGSAELRAPRNTMCHLAAALRSRRVPVVATNLFCDESAQTLCDVIVDGNDGISMFNVGERRLAFVSFLDEAAARRVSAQQIAGLTIGTRAEYLPKAVRRAREAGANLVVAVLHASSNDEALELASSLPEDGRPDLLFVARAGSELLFARPPTVTPAIVGAPPGGAVHVRVRWDEVSDRYDFATAPSPRSEALSEEYEQWLADTGAFYCRTWGRDLEGGRVDEPLSGDDLLDLAARVLRDATGAEIAIVNRGALDDDWTPMRAQSLTASDVFMAFQYDEPFMVSEVDADWLEEIRDRPNLVVVGLGEEDVNSRPISADGTYRVVTLRYLAEGGDGSLPEAEFTAIEGATFRDALIGYLSIARTEHPRDAAWDPAEALEWILRLAFDGSFSGTAVGNPSEGGMPAYTSAQLARTGSVTAGFEARIELDALSEWLGWENDARASFFATRPDAEEFTEGTDELSYRTNLVYRGFYADDPEVYVPEPYFEGYLESEITIPEEREFRHLLIQPTLGLRFHLSEELQVSLGAGFQWEALDPNESVIFGGVARVELEPWALLEDGDRKMTFGGALEYFVSRETQQLRAELEMVYDLAGPLSFVLDLGAFAQKDPDLDLGIAADTTISLRLGWAGRVVR